jgi:hypothetical protein
MADMFCHGRQFAYGKSGSWAWWTIGALSVLALATCDTSKPTQTSRRVETWTPQERAAFAKLKSEPRVRDILFDKGQAVEWNIGVFDDGTRRYGFGQYVCEVLKEEGALRSDTQVRIVDIAKVVREKVPPKAANLGTVDCASLQPSYAD